jgi:hypothetical protein
MMFKCHCRDCQRVTGGPYIPVVVVRLTDIKFTKGTPVYYATQSLRGSNNVRGFCGKCGSRLTGGENKEHNFIGVTASSLDDPGLFKPAMDIFVSDAHPWDVMDPNLPKHQEYMPRK